MTADETSAPRLMTGNEAVAEAAMAAGLTFFAGYPITPSSEIAETLAESLPAAGGVFLQMEDEIAAMGAVIGASIAGARSMTATSGPGFSLKQEGIGYASETEVPCVIVNVMRGGPSTGMPTLPAQADVMQARWGTHGDHSIIALIPERVSEAYELTFKAFALAERFRSPVILLLDEVVAHVTEKVVLPARPPVIPSNRETTLPPEQYRPYDFSGRFAPPLVPFGRGYRYHITGLHHLPDGFPTNDPTHAGVLTRWLYHKIEDHTAELTDVECTGCQDADLLLVAYGACSRSAKAAMRLARDRGMKVGLFRPRTLWPFPEAALEAATAHARVALVAEMNMGQIAHEVAGVLRRKVRVEKLCKVGGDPLFPEELLDAMMRL
jgi:2-oxoglutarate ferredoxin oxidoreductase subunit alpha